MTLESDAPGLDESILLATRDREPVLRETLERFRRLDLGGARRELIVVDDGSRDGTSAVLEAARGTLPLTALRPPEPGRNRARNVALPAARGALLVFTDDDVVPEAGQRANLIAAARRRPEHGVLGGPVTPVLPPETPAWLLGERDGLEAGLRLFEARGQVYEHLARTREARSIAWLLP